MYIADIVNNKQSLSVSFADWSHCFSIYTVKLWHAASINAVDCVACFRHVTNGIMGRGIPGIAR